MELKSIVHNPRNKRQILHVEAPGCVVNIQPGLPVNPDAPNKPPTPPTPPTPTISVLPITTRFMNINLEIYIGYQSGQWVTETFVVALPVGTNENQIGAVALKTVEQALEKLPLTAFWGIYHWQYAESTE